MTKTETLQELIEQAAILANEIIGKEGEPADLDECHMMLLGDLVNMIIHDNCTYSIANDKHLAEARCYISRHCQYFGYTKPE